jgi:eukaryotic-like serine/threonine-protein kinase
MRKQAHPNDDMISKLQRSFAANGRSIDITVPNRLSDRYELGEIIAFGGMSEVHIGRDLHLHRDVAVKVLRSDLARDPVFYLRFRLEAQRAAALSHPAIVAVYDTGESQTPNGPTPYIVMEYVEGKTLRDILQADGPFEVLHAIEIIADACQALNFSHQHGIVHRDVKPANIMIDNTGAVKVMDFGIAKALGDTSGKITRTAAVLGTAQYLSPEQARGETVDARSDVYSLSCVLYEILTGEPPFVGDSPLAVAYQHVREDAVPPSSKRHGIAPELDAVVLKGLAKNPENRYQTAADMRADLVRVRAGESPDAPKVFTDAERTLLLTTGARHGLNMPTQPNQAQPRAADRKTAAPVGRWLLTVTVLAVLTVVVTVAISMIGKSPRNVSVPDVTGKPQADAIATLQNRGFRTNFQARPDPKMGANRVISTDPAANSQVSAGDEITVNLSSGPPQLPVPDVRGLAIAEARRRLQDAGFPNVQQTSAVSTSDKEGSVVNMMPPPDSTSPISNTIVIVVGSGPQTIPVPPVTGQPATSAKTVLTAAGFTNLVDVPTDNTAPAGRVLGTVPAANEVVPKDQVIQIQVSRGNQFLMPSLVGRFYDDVVPYLAGMGFHGPLLNGGEIAGVQDSDKNRVMKQDPPAGTVIGYDGIITLIYGS